VLLDALGGRIHAVHQTVASWPACRREMWPWATSQWTESASVTWRSRGATPKERVFEAFLRDRAVPLVSQQAGLVAQHVGRPRDPSSTEYVYVTVWEDVESIRAFAGERWQEAVITPDEERLLKDTWNGHYEVLPTPE
jgi:heme-degrading monooxygenase HmoA